MIFYSAGDFHLSLRRFTERAREMERHGRLAETIIPWANIARCHNALGDFAAARAAYERATALTARLTGLLPQLVLVLGARWEMCGALDEGLEEMAAAGAEVLGRGVIDNRWAEAVARAAMALIAARLAGEAFPAHSHRYLCLAKSLVPPRPVLWSFTDLREEVDGYITSVGGERGRLA